MKFGLSDHDRSIIVDEIHQNLGSTLNPKIYIYGSRVKGNFREFSDIDLLLKADSFDLESLGRIDFAELDTPYKVDFILDKDLFRGYREEIEAHMVEL